MLLWYPDKVIHTYSVDHSPHCSVEGLSYWWMIPPDDDCNNHPYLFTLATKWPFPSITTAKYMHTVHVLENYPETSTADQKLLCLAVPLWVVALSVPAWMIVPVVLRASMMGRASCPIAFSFPAVCLPGSMAILLVPTPTFWTATTAIVCRPIPWGK